MPGGWRLRIPLQQRIGNGYVFASSFLSEDEACEDIRAAAAGERIAEPRLLRFRPGRRTRSWSRNVVGVGLASGFLEPLESTSLYLTQMAITYLIELFPQDGRIDTRDRDEFNRLVDMEYDRIRDFLILHYHATVRDDAPFWRSEAHTSELQSLMRISYAVFCLKKNTTTHKPLYCTHIYQAGLR